MILSTMWLSLILVSGFLAAVTGEPRCKCETPMTFLEEMKCKPVYEKPDDCCPKKYDCSELDKKPKDKCHLLGVFYNTGETVPDEVVYHNCNVNCRCNKGGPPNIYPGSDFVCAILDCPEWLGMRPKPGCHFKYDVTKCCSVGQNCPPFDKLPKCVVDGKTYYEGQKFEPSEDKTVKCVCGKDFKGKFEEPFCIKKQCMSEIRNAVDIDKYCAPVFFKTSKKDEPECPFNFICPEKTDDIKRSARSSEDKCTFGELKLNIGDSFSRVENINDFENHNIDCNCKIPPYVTCLKTIKYDFDKMPEHIKEYIKREDYE